MCQVLCVIKQRGEESREKDETEDMNTRGKQLSLETKGCSLLQSLCTCECGRREQADPRTELSGSPLLAREPAYIKFGLFAACQGFDPSNLSDP